LTIHGLWLRAAAELGGEVLVEFSREVLHKFSCPSCGKDEVLFAPVGTVAYETGRCSCNAEIRTVEAIHFYSGREDFGSRKLAELGLPLFDVFVARNESCERAYLIAGDSSAVLGALANPEDAQ
jgi:hypothetical protein